MQNGNEIAKHKLTYRFFFVHRKVEPITFRVASGKCVLVGGLARIEVIGDTKPFLFTFFVANDIKLHPTSSDKADTFIETHVRKALCAMLYCSNIY